MSTIRRMIAVLFLFSVVNPIAKSFALESVSLYSDLTNVKAERIINLQTHVEEVVYSFQVENKGSQPASFYLLPISSSKIGHLSHAQASTGTTNATPLKVTRVLVSDAPSSNGYLKIDLLSPLKPSATVSINVLVAFTRVLKPFPASITQSESQLTLYEDNLYILSLYETSQQQTQVKLASDKISSYTKKQASVKGDTIEYGPYSDISVLAYSPLSIHFENNFPFVTMTSMKKLIEISHFGNVNVEEWYNLEHSGAQLKGSFSRFEYQRNPNAKGASFRQITAILPLHATDLYYRDQIGNVSTSHVRETEKSIEFEVLPRFPMFGGWKTDFYLGYNLPLSEYLSIDSSDSSSYVLNISFGSPFPQAAIDEEEIRVILPEFATGIKWVTPFEVDDEGRDVHVTYLDTVGRPVLVLKKKNVVRYHDQPFQVQYKFSKVYMFQEPLILSSAFFLFFLTSWIYMRIDLSLSDSSNDEGQVRSNRTGKQGTVINRILVRNVEIVRQVQGTPEEVESASSAVQNIRSDLEELKKDASLSSIADRVDTLYKDVIATAKKARGEGQASRLKGRIDELKGALSQLASA